MKNKVSKLQLVFAMLTVAVMVVIFMFSCEDAEDSSDTSGFFVDMFLRLFIPDFSSMTADRQEELHGIISHFIRKGAHFTVYMALGFCSSMTAGKRNLLTPKSGFVMLFCCLYACSDEFHQYFVPGRACQFTDVMIDSCGAVIGQIISLIAIRIRTCLHKGCVRIFE